MSAEINELDSLLLDYKDDLLDIAYRKKRHAAYQNGEIDFDEAYLDDACDCDEDDFDDLFLNDVITLTPYVG